MQIQQGTPHADTHMMVEGNNDTNKPDFSDEPAVQSAPPGPATFVQHGPARPTLPSWELCHLAVPTTPAQTFRLRTHQ